jgi:hypothetical protein
MTDGSPDANYQSILAMKQNIEIMQGTRGIVRATSLHAPTTVNTQTGAALRKVQATYP